MNNDEMDNALIIVMVKIGMKINYNLTHSSFSEFFIISGNIKKYLITSNQEK